MAFNINAQVILSGPKNISAVTKQIKTQLKGISVPVNITIDKNISKNLGAFNKGVKTLTGNLQGLTTASNRADASIRSLVSGFRDLSTASTKISRSQSLVASSLGQSSQAMREAGSELQQFGKDAALAIRRFTAFTVATGVVFGFVRAIQQATSAAIEYEREIVKVVQVTGAQSSKIGQLKRTIDDLSVSLGVDANELASLARTFAQTGQTIDQVRDSIRAVARSALAPSFGTMKSTAEGLIAAMAQFNIGANKSEQVLGSLNAVSKKFAVEAEDLISVIRRAGGVFSAAAGQMKDPQEALQELAGIFVAVRSTTRESADTIATGLRTIFTRIQRRGTIDFLKQFNIELIDAKGNFIGLFPAFAQLEKGLKGLIQSGDAVSLSAVTEELGGIRQVGKLIPAIVNFNKALAATKIAAQGAAEGLGKDVQLALQPLGKQFEVVAARFNTLIRTISESKTFQNLAKVAISTANAFLSVAESLTPLIPLITTLTTIKITKGLFEFGKGFVGGLKKGGGAGGAGGALGGAITGGGGGPTGGAPGVKAGVDKALALALRSNTTAVHSNTTALGRVNSSLVGVHRNIELLGQTFMNETRKLIVALGTVNPGFKPTKFARGGPVRGPSHAAGGVPAILEGGEYVIPKGYQNGGVGEDIEVSAAQIGSGISKKSVRRGGGGQRSFGVAYLRPEGIDQQLTYDLKMSDFITKGGGEGPRQQLGRATLGGDFRTGKKIDKLALQKGAIRGVGVGNVAGFSSSIKGAEDTTSVTLHQGSLSETVGDQFEAKLKEASRKVAKDVIGAIIGNGFDQNSYSRGLDKANPTQSIGNLYEAALGATLGKWDEKRVNANSPFDYPSGLGNVGSKFDIPAGIPTDAKRSFTKETLGNLIKKSRNQIDQEAVDSILQGSLAARIGGSEGSLTDSKTNLQALIGRGERTVSELTSDYKGLGFDLTEGGTKKGDYTIKPRYKAAGGSIFAPQGTDTVPAMLTPGEYVINRSSAQAIGYGQLDKMNRMAAGGRVQYLNDGGGITSATTSRRSDMEGTSGGLIDKLGALTVVVGGVTTAFAGLDITSMTSVLSSAASLAFTFQQLAFFAPGVSKALLGGIGGKLGKTGIGRNIASSFGGIKGGFGKAATAFKNQGRPADIITGKFLQPEVKGFRGFLKSSSAGLSAFTKSIGGVTGFFKGLPGLLTALLAAPIVNAALNKAFGKIEEVAPGIRGRRGMTAGGAAGAAGAGSAVIGGLTGAAIGSMILPVVGTAIGAAVGAIGSGIVSALSAFEDQKLFNIFTEITEAGEGVKDIFEKIAQNQGFLDEGDQGRLDKAVEEMSKSFRKVTEVAVGSLSSWDRIQNFFSGGQFAENAFVEGEGIKSREAAQQLLKSVNEKLEEQGVTREGLQLNVESLFGRIIADNANVQQNLANAFLTETTTRPAIDRDMTRRTTETTSFGSGFGARTTQTGTGTPGFKEIFGPLVAEGNTAAETFRDLQVAMSAGVAGSEKLESALESYNNQQNFLLQTSLIAAVTDQQAAHDKVGNTKASEALNRGMRKLRTEMGDTGLSALSTAENAARLPEALRRVEQDLKDSGDFSDEASEGLGRLLNTLLHTQNESVRTAYEIQKMVELQKRAVQSTKFFSLELQKFAESTTDAATRFGDVAADAKSDIDVLLGGQAKFKPLKQKFTGTDAQFRFLEQGGPRANSLRGLSDLEKQLPAIIKRTVVEQQGVEQATGRDVNATELTAALKKNILAAVPGAPQAAVDQVLAKLSGSIDREGVNVVDNLDKVAKMLIESAGDTDALSGIAADAKTKTTAAFDALISVYNAYGSFLEQRNRVEAANLARIVAFGRKLDQVNDQISGMLGGRGPSQAQERSRRQRDLTLISGANQGQLPMGAGGQMQALQTARNILQGRRRRFDDTRRGDPSQVNQQFIDASNANMVALNKVTDAIKALNDTMDKELTAALNALQRTINEQLQSEQGIQTLADVALAISKGDMSVYDAEERFGPLLRAAEELTSATAAGRPAQFSNLAELAALQKGIATEDPLIMGLIRQMARQRSPGNPDEWIRNLRSEMAGLLSRGTSATLAAQGWTIGARTSQRLTGEQAASEREIRVRRANVGSTLADRQAANEAQSRGEGAGAAPITLTTEQEFSAAVGKFAAAVLAFENALAGRDAQRQRVRADVGNNRGGLIQNFARGGMVRGPSHAQGGVLIRAEGGEHVIPKKFANGGPVLGPRGDASVSVRSQRRKDREAGLMTDLSDKARARNLKKLERINASRAKRGLDPLQPDAFGRPIPDTAARAYKSRAKIPTSFTKDPTREIGERAKPRRAATPPPVDIRSQKGPASLTDTLPAARVGPGMDPEWARITAIKDPLKRYDEMQAYNIKKRTRKRRNKETFEWYVDQYLKKPVDERPTAYRPSGDQTDWEQHVEEVNKRSDEAVKGATSAGKPIPGMFPGEDFGNFQKRQLDQQKGVRQQDKAKADASAAALKKRLEKIEHERIFGKFDEETGRTVGGEQAIRLAGRFRREEFERERFKDFKYIGEGISNVMTPLTMFQEHVTAPIGKGIRGGVGVVGGEIGVGIEKMLGGVRTEGLGAMAEDDIAGIKGRLVEQMQERPTLGQSIGSEFAGDLALGLVTGGVSTAAKLSKMNKLKNVQTGFREAADFGISGRLAGRTTEDILQRGPAARSIAARNARWDKELAGFERAERDTTRAAATAQHEAAFQKYLKKKKPLPTKPSSTTTGSAGTTGGTGATGSAGEAFMDGFLAVPLGTIDAVTGLPLGPAVKAAGGAAWNRIRGFFSGKWKGLPFTKQRKLQKRLAEISDIPDAPISSSLSPEDATAAQKFLDDKAAADTAAGMAKRREAGAGTPSDASSLNLPSDKVFDDIVDDIVGPDLDPQRAVQVGDTGVTTGPRHGGIAGAGVSRGASRRGLLGQAQQQAAVDASPFGMGNILETGYENERYIARVRLANGKEAVFYRSSGEAAEAGLSTGKLPGEWQPLFGGTKGGSSSAVKQGRSEWFIKGGKGYEVTGRPLLEQAQTFLNKRLATPDIPGADSYELLKAFEAANPDIVKGTGAFEGLGDLSTTAGRKGRNVQGLSERAYGQGMFPDIVHPQKPGGSMYGSAAEQAAASARDTAHREMILRRMGIDPTGVGDTRVPRNFVEAAGGAQPARTPVAGQLDDVVGFGQVAPEGTMSSAHTTRLDMGLYSDFPDMRTVPSAAHPPSMQTPVVPPTRTGYASTIYDPLLDIGGQTGAGGRHMFEELLPPTITGRGGSAAVPPRPPGLWIDELIRPPAPRRRGVPPGIGYNKGGFVPGFNSGGPNVDSVNAKLTPGEWVMRREAVQKYGEKFMNDVNLQKLNNGGRNGPPVGGASGNTGKANDLERGAKLAGDSILKAFTEGATKAANAIKEALSPENLAAQIGDVVGQKMKESIAATEIKMTTTSQVNLTGDGATGDMGRKVEGTIKDAIAGAFNNRTNVDGSAKDPSLHRDSLA